MERRLKRRASLASIGATYDNIARDGDSLFRI